MGYWNVHKYADRINLLLVKLKISLGKVEAFIPAAAFLAGIFWDTVTIGRIDQWSNMVQLGIYVVLALGLVMIEFAEISSDLTIKVRGTGIIARVWEFRTDAVHFLLGSLLSAFTIFFVKSSSIWGSLSFIALIAAALVANEFKGFRQIGLQIRISLTTLCAACYFACIVPVVLKQIGLVAFLLAIFATVLLLGAGLLCIGYLDRRKSVSPKNFELFIAPALVTLGSFGAFYASGLIPPVPLALTKVGIYRGVERIHQKYELSYSLNPWRFWEKGEQTFLARPGDRVYVFFSVFSPEGFRESIAVRWYFNDPEKSNGYELKDTTLVKVLGGRVAGYRGFAYKSRYQYGDWQVRIGTEEGAEIGRINLEISQDDLQTPRAFVTESF